MDRRSFLAATALSAAGTAVPKIGPLMSANGMVRPCSGPASRRSWQGAPKTRSTPCHPAQFWNRRDRYRYRQEQGKLRLDDPVAVVQLKLALAYRAKMDR